ncbi:SDR family NAD(P)-dependent oxidoreductase [Dactylosporangium aurantiacum]|uniref:SDR family NAD(P)-dependent oxidoreductase n=1 Tax=Dactylosporangium aurantiacum TaxID=35754 RepID=A0A9Q9IF16_9ACTN|nr:SDR family NAD(P)-dependent oxidoreductase [Dactylosporangium aurantiacum]MDG6109592.1 SDR family NAD(P)-dependent oxidoreductase [Dactylosporangium aurantiacum]UWZ54216.1 SDR family NAD(P)-dependent oxidoreductase [Dactylosporangium aurantiacum]
MTRTVVVTGGSAGIGLAAARRFAAAGDRVVLLGRHEGRLDAALASVRAAGATDPLAVRADFADRAQVRAAAARVAAACDRVDVLVNNAGGLTRGAACLRVNHLAGFELAHLLLERLTAAARPGAPARIVTTASLAEAWGVLDVDRPLRESLWHRSRWLAYGSSKQANLLFTVEAARRWSPLGVLPTAFFPGLVRSRFASTSPLFMLGKLIPVLYAAPHRAADTLLWLADAPAAGLTPGGYYFLRQPFAATPRSTSLDRAGRLWRASLTATGVSS